MIENGIHVLCNIPFLLASMILCRLVFFLVLPRLLNKTTNDQTIRVFQEKNCMLHRTNAANFNSEITSLVADAVHKLETRTLDAP